jgi:hypothetical protein
MQSPKENGKQKFAAGTDSQQHTELSDAWRSLLGLQPGENTGQVAQSEPTAPVQPLASDPWSHLLQAQGMQPVDLQKVHLHDLHPAANDDDVEHALDLMQEATDSPAAQDKKQREV